MRFDDYSKDLTIDRRPDAPQTPTVSVILPTYVRGDGMLGRAIDSILSQSYGDLELIVVDDGSRDGTADVLSEYQRADPRILVHRHRFNSGLPALRVNQAALAARGRLIAYQFDDDVWPQESLAMRVEALRGRETPAVVYGISEMEIETLDEPPVRRRVGEPFNYGKLVGGNYIANNSVLHPVELFEIAGMYDPHILIRRFSDYDLWLRFGAIVDFIFVDDVVSHVHANQPRSLGNTVVDHFITTRKYLAIDRNDALKPSAIKSYDIAGTTLLRQDFSDAEIDQFRRRTIIPFLAIHHDYAPGAALLPAMISRRTRKTLLVAKPDFSTSVDVTIRNFTGLDDAPYRDVFIKENDLGAVDWCNIDIVVMYRTILEYTTLLLEALKSHKTFVYLMDDNMLRFSEVGPEHRYLAPGTPNGIAIESQIREAHGCIGYSEQIIQDMRSLNPRTIRFDTNMPLKLLEPRPYLRTSRLRVGVLSGAVRRDIMRQLWPALVAFAETAPDAVEFHFWGLDPAEFGPLPCTVEHRPFTHSYDLYRRRLLNASFDVLLVPLDDRLLSLQSKSPVKLLESICCGAVCIFTDTVPYRDLPDEICLKTPNTVDGWQSALERARALGPEGRTAMLERARIFTQQRYATERQFADFAAGFDAVQLHRYLKDRSIAYVFHETALGGATLHLLRHAQLARSLGFGVVAVINDQAEGDRWGFADRWKQASGCGPLIRGHWTSGYVPGADRHRTPHALDREHGEALAALLAPHHVGLIHGATWNPVVTSLGKALKAPVAVSQHQFYPTEAGAARGAADAIHCSSLRYARDWEQAMQRPVRRIVCPVEQVFFDSFTCNLLWHRQRGTALRLLVSGTLQRRKNQLEAIRAVGLLVQQGQDVTLDLIGYDELVPDYVEACRQEIISLGLQDRVTIHGFTDTPERFYQNRCRILLMPSTSESMPQTVLQAMAAGLLVVTTDVGGVGEIIQHRYGGIIAEGADAAALAKAIGLGASLSTDQIEEMLQRAHRTIDLIGREQYVRAELIDLYNEAFENSSFGERAGASNAPISVTIMDRSREVRSLQARIRQLESSLSFRVTAPLRAVARKLRPIAWLANRIR